MHNCYILHDNRFNKDFHYSAKFIKEFDNFFDLQKEHFPTYSIKGQKHHWQYRYVYDEFIPRLFSDYEMTIDYDDFNLRNVLIEDNDFSYLFPKTEQKIRLHDLHTNKMFEGDFNIFYSLNKNYNYHRVFRLHHRCSKIHNLKIKNGKRLLLNCDSMSIPIIPLLALYYEYILVLDNRTKNVSFKKIIKEFNATDKLTILIAGNDIAGNDAEKRYKLNLR